MVDLLKRWAASGDVALQDDFEGIVVIQHPRCYLHTEGEPDGYCVVHSGFWHGFRVDPNRPADRAHILAAVIEAIEARGWSWASDYRPGLGYAATVWAADATTGEANDQGTLVAAVLTAHLNCIEALAALEATQ